jgi:hypothetical protein
MPDSRFGRSAVATVTLTGASAVGGVTNTAISLHLDSTIRFVDANGVTQVVPVPAHYTTGFKNTIQPSSGTAKDGPAGALFALFDALYRRAQS